MSETWVRLGLVLGALGIAAAVALSIRARNRSLGVAIGDTRLVSGVYLFTSERCLECGPARRTIAEALGRGGFTEIRWEEAPELFADLGIETVPSTLVVSDGAATLYRGRPEAALRAVDP